jgi:hypothetical protein
MDKHKVTWITDCEYILEPIVVWDEDFRKRNVKKIYVKIIEVFPNKYRYESRIDDDPFVVRGEIEKVN